MLLAQAVEAAHQSEIDKWIGPILTSVCSMIAALFAFLSTRDKNRNEIEAKRLDLDVRLVKMEFKVTDLEDEVRECHEDREAQRAELAALRARSDANEVRHEKDHPASAPGD